MKVKDRIKNILPEDAQKAYSHHIYEVSDKIYGKFDWRCILNNIKELWLLLMSSNKQQNNQEGNNRIIRLIKITLPFG